MSFVDGVGIGYLIDGEGERQTSHHTCVAIYIVCLSLLLKQRAGANMSDKEGRREISYTGRIYNRAVTVSVLVSVSVLALGSYRTI